jgi:hypothetical protein
MGRLSRDVGPVGLGGLAAKRGVQCGGGLHIHPEEVRSMREVLPSLEHGRHSILEFSVIADEGKLVHLGEPALAETQRERARTSILCEAGKVSGIFVVVLE